MPLQFNGASTAIGGIHADLAVPVRAAELFVAGMVNYMLHANDLHDLESCL